MLINNNDANGLVTYWEIRLSLMLSMIWQKEGWKQFKNNTLVNNYQ